MSRFWMKRVDFYSTPSTMFQFVLNRKDFSCTCFLHGDTGKRITNLSFMSDCTSNLEARYNRLIKSLKLSDKLFSRTYYFNKE